MLQLLIRRSVIETVNTREIACQDTIISSIAFTRSCRFLLGGFMLVDHTTSVSTTVNANITTRADRSSQAMVQWILTQRLRPGHDILHESR